jgi:magnesium-protoporphyrin O-methyltransferase
MAARTQDPRQTATYDDRRRKLEQYFDRTAVDAWAKLTSDAKVSRIRATVRAGRDRMRATLLSYLPDDLIGARVLDAGCGTGSFAVEAARRGADVVAIDISPTLVQLAKERTARQQGCGTLDFRVSDMLEPSLGHFDWIVAMDSIIHYEPADMAAMIARLYGRASKGMVFTFAPKTVMTSLMWATGKAFPRADRSPDIVPMAEGDLVARVTRHADMGPCRIGRSERIDVGFYLSQTMEILRP